MALFIAIRFELIFFSLSLPMHARRVCMDIILKWTKTNDFKRMPVSIHGDFKCEFYKHNYFNGNGNEMKKNYRIFGG